MFGSFSITETIFPLTVEKKTWDLKRDLKKKREKAGLKVLIENPSCGPRMYRIFLGCVPFAKSFSVIGAAQSASVYRWGSENGNGTYVLKIVAEVHPKEEKPEKMVFYAKKPYHRTEKMIFTNFRI